VTLFTSTSKIDSRKTTLQEFCKPNSVLRVVVAGSAFGMGVNVPDIAHVVNWGLSRTLEDLLQQTGRAGRNGLPAEAILYCRNSCNKVSKEITEFIKNNTLYQRCLLFKAFYIVKQSKI